MDFPTAALDWPGGTFLGHLRTKISLRFSTRHTRNLCRPFLDTGCEWKLSQGFSNTSLRVQGKSMGAGQDLIGALYRKFSIPFDGRTLATANPATATTRAYLKKRRFGPMFLGTVASDGTRCRGRGYAVPGRPSMAFGISPISLSIADWMWEMIHRLVRNSPKKWSVTPMITYQMKHHSVKFIVCGGPNRTETNQSG